MPRISLEYKFTISGIIQIALLLGGFVAMYYAVVGNVATNAKDIVELRRITAPIESLNVRLTVIETRAASTDQQINTLVASIDKLVDQINLDRIGSAQVKTDVGYLRDWVETLKREARGP